MGDRNKNLRDQPAYPLAEAESDNHLIELAVAARADAIVTRNVKDITTGELRFPALKVLTPEQCLV